VACRRNGSGAYLCCLRRSSAHSACTRCCPTYPDPPSTSTVGNPVSTVGILIGAVAVVVVAVLVVLIVRVCLGVEADVFQSRQTRSIHFATSLPCVHFTILSLTSTRNKHCTSEAETDCTLFLLFCLSTRKKIWGTSLSLVVEMYQAHKHRHLCPPPHTHTLSLSLADSHQWQQWQQWRARKRRLWRAVLSC
jgi:hypothetical protein